MSTRINLTHAQSRERNAQFMDIVRKPETEQQYNLRMPMSAIYKLMPEVDEQFGVRSAAVVALDSSDSG